MKLLMGVEVTQQAVDSHDPKCTSEAGVGKRLQLEYAQNGDILWRNNVGACEDNRGNHIRYGLANVSKGMNKRVKSSDYVGIRKVLITPEMVGQTIGQFTAIETKKPGWVFTGSDREVAQRRFIELVIALGGHAKFQNTVDSI